MRTLAEDPAGAADAPRARLQRAAGVVSARIKRRDGRNGAVSALDHLHQSGSGKARLPKTYGAGIGGAPEIVLLNTSGGLTGGDRMDVSIEAAAGAETVVSTQAAERVYRALPAEAPAEVSNRLTLGPGARLDWLPQETILFDGGRLSRRLEIAMAEDARLLAVEAVVVGRAAMGETVREGLLSDHWRLRRGGRLVFADALRLTAPIDQALARAACAGGALASATLLYAAPDAEARREAARAQVAEIEAATGAAAGVSAWDGMLSARFLAGSGAQLRRALFQFLEGFRGAPLPRVWRL